MEQTWNEVPNHIPIGLHHDLIDEGEDTYRVGEVTISACNQLNSGCTLVDDRVSGFSNAQIFRSIPRQVTTIDPFRQRLISTELSNTSDSINQINALFDSY
ncbi:MAG: hypothetical protein AAFV80_18165 [Bacteroidota bacterium]